MNRGDLRAPLALTMALRAGTRQLPHEVVRDVFVEDVAEGVTVAVWRHAALASCTADHAAQLVDVLLRTPRTLAIALAAAEAGAPITAKTLGLNGDSILASLGRHIASGVDAEANPG